jgi:hypothetical protein
MTKHLLLQSIEKFLEKERTGTKSTDDKLTKGKFHLKTYDNEPYVLYDDESSIFVITNEDLIKKIVSSQKKPKNENEGSFVISIKKASPDVLFTTDIDKKSVLRVVLNLEDFEVESHSNKEKSIPKNVNSFRQVSALISDLYSYYISNKISETKFDQDSKQVNALTFKTKKYDGEFNNFLSFKNDGVYFLLKSKAFLKNAYLYVNNEYVIDNESLIKILKEFDLEGTLLKNTNLSGVKELKPTPIDLSKIQSTFFTYDNVDEEYIPYLKQTSLSNPASTLNKEIFLKHKRRRTNIPKPAKGNQTLQNLYNNYQDVLSNLTVGVIEKYVTMLKYKETISN